MKYWMENDIRGTIMSVEPITVHNGTRRAANTITKIILILPLYPIKEIQMKLNINI